MTTATEASGRLDAAVIRVRGAQPLNGRIQVQGSKNIALHLYAAALAADTVSALDNCPAILDTQVCAGILRHTGAAVETGHGRFTVTPAASPRPVIHPVLGRRVRTTVVLAAALLSRAGRAEFPQPGGMHSAPGSSTGTWPRSRQRALTSHWTATDTLPAARRAACGRSRLT